MSHEIFKSGVLFFPEYRICNNKPSVEHDEFSEQYDPYMYFMRYLSPMGFWGCLFGLVGYAYMVSIGSFVYQNIYEIAFWVMFFALGSCCGLVLRRSYRKPVVITSLGGSCKIGVHNRKNEWLNEFETGLTCERVNVLLRGVSNKNLPKYDEQMWGVWLSISRDNRQRWVLLGMFHDVMSAEQSVVDWSKMLGGVGDVERGVPPSNCVYVEVGRNNSAKDKE